MVKASSWYNDWATFVRDVGGDFGKGLSDSGVSAKYSGREVIWIGTVGEKRFGTFTSGVQMDMPAEKIVLSDGRWAIVNYLFLNVPKDAIETWQGVEDGATIRFRALLEEGNEFFPGIRWSTVGADGMKGGVLIGTKDGALVDILTRPGQK